MIEINFTNAVTLMLLVSAPTAVGALLLAAASRLAARSGVFHPLLQPIIAALLAVGGIATLFFGVQYALDQVYGMKQPVHYIDCGKETTT